MTSVAEMISANAAKYAGHPPVVHDAVHGTTDPEAIEHQIAKLVRSALGSVVTEGVFHVASVGSVTGVRLDDGRLVVIKAYQHRWTQRFLQAVSDAQASLADAGFACARPVVDPQPFGAGWATIETLLADPGQPATFGSAEMRASARGLAALINATPPSPGLLDNPLQQPFEGLYPVPHSPLFDFDATAAGAEWIDELAALAKAHLHLGRVVVAHTDWAARNVRLSPTGVRAIYDLDSLGIVPLPAALGQAAVTWRSTAEPGDDPAPGVEEIDAWLTAYPGSLTDDERRAVFAHALWHLAYSSRCEHAIDPHEAVHQRARPTLRDQADELLRRLPHSAP